jgi:cytochrome c oxidase assembly factor CtaG
MSGVIDTAALDAALLASRCFGGATGSGWSLAPALLAPLALSLLLYGRGVAKLWQRAGPGRVATWPRIGLFAAGWAVLAVALLSPLHEASRRLFSAHMIEHELVMAAAAPLLVAARPGPALLWALPRALRHALGAVLASAPVRRLRRATGRPTAATIQHGLAIWLWHVPVLFTAALTSEAMHWLQHLTFLGSALAFWWVMLGRVPQDRGAALAGLFVTSLHTSLLGVLLVVSHHLWVPLQELGADFWNLTPLEDQQLAGLVMWIPAGLVYPVATLILAGRWVTGAGGWQARSKNHVLSLR